MLTSNVIAIGSCTGTTAENVRSKVVNLLAVLVTDDVTSGSSCISSQYYSIL